MNGNGIRNAFLACFVALAPAAAAADAPPLESALATSGRPAEDISRDAGRQPAAVVDFLGIMPGMTVLDLIAAGGYYTEVLSIAVGPEGRVYAQNGDYVLRLRDGANDKAMTARLANERLPNVTRLDREIADLGLPDDSIDAALTALNFHDVYNSGGSEAATAFLTAVYRVLKPGGVLGIIDHSGAPDGNNADLHRIDEQRVVDVALGAGYLMEGRSDILANPDDPLNVSVFDPSVRGATDRFLLRLRKPDLED